MDSSDSNIPLRCLLINTSRHRVTTTEQNPPPRCEVPWDRSDPAQQELTDLLSSLKHDITLMGVFSLGRDGVMRSLTADRRVVDAIGLTPAQVAVFLGRLPAASRAASDVAEGADGTKVPREQWFHPDKDLLPAPMSQEVREKSEQERREREERDPGWAQRTREMMEARGCKFA
jgi:hypothetical protein